VSRERSPWWLGLAALGGSWLVRLLARTWRYEVLDRAEYTAALANGERFVYAFWHSGILPAAYLRRGEGIAVLVSQHRDGELITRLIERLGYVAARGSSTRGGDQGTREMLAWAALGRHLAVTPDGPRGPAEQVKAGAFYLAARTGRRVVPIGFGASPAWLLRSWDRFRVPKPFARVCVTHGAPLALEPEGDDAEARGRAALEAAIHAVTLETRTRAGAAT
jgi:lysophospholipid acyltransferase (LPLAT)-like uncharacterized protein